MLEATNWTWMFPDEGASGPQVSRMTFDTSALADSNSEKVLSYSVQASLPVHL